MPIWFSVNYNGVTGFYASAFDDSQYSSDTDLTQRYGIPRCESAVLPSSQQDSEAPDIDSVFFSPISGDPHAYQANQIADLDLEFDEWKGSPDCMWNNAVAAVPKSVTTLSGWSVGRLGPIYFLSGADSSQIDRIRTIVLYDPGSKQNFETSCDINYNIKRLLADWLSSNLDNRLIVFTGHDSEDKGWHDFGHSTFAGLWEYYFPNIWNQPFADQAMICDYDGMEHDDVLGYFRWVVETPPSSCPEAPDETPVQQWHP